MSDRDRAPRPERATGSAATPVLPPAHVWGPVMVIPWAGPRECAEALSTARADSGCAPIRAVVLDATGVAPHAAALWPLLAALAALREAGVEVVVAGLCKDARVQLAASFPPLERPFHAPDSAAAIALAFQAVG